MTKLVLISLTVTLMTSAGCTLPPEDEGRTDDDAEDIDSEMLDDAEESGIQAAGPGCLLLHPYAWNVAGTGCVESRYGWPEPPAGTFLPDGATYRATAEPNGLFGEGYADVSCQGAALVAGRKRCRPSTGVPQ